MSKSYLERYRAGEREAVWHELVTMGEGIQQSSIYEDALEVARETMGRALANVQRLVVRLEHEGYGFDYPDEILVSPPSDMAAKIARIECEAGVLPLSLRAFFEVVGSVNLIGHDEALCPDVGEVYSDPLVVASIEYVVSEMENWRQECVAYGDDDTGPFGVPISPDDHLKSDTSGGPEYRVLVGRPSMDGKLVHERHDILFVDYLRLSFAWGGFPGFDRAEAHPPTAILDRLRRGLLEI